MTMGNIGRTWVSIFAAIVVLMAVIFTMPNYAIEPKAIFLPAGLILKPYTGFVEIYDTRTEPFISKTVGVINLRYHINNFDEKTQRLIFTKLKAMAAEAGGNAVVLDYQRTGLTPTEGPLQVLVVTAKVITTRISNSINVDSL